MFSKFTLKSLISKELLLIFSASLVSVSAFAETCPMEATNPVNWINGTYNIAPYHGVLSSLNPQLGTEVLTSNKYLVTATNIDGVQYLGSCFYVVTFQQTGQPESGQIVAVTRSPNPPIVLEKIGWVSQEWRNQPPQLSCNPVFDPYHTAPVNDNSWCRWDVAPPPPSRKQAAVSPFGRVTP